MTPRAVTHADSQDLFGLLALCFAEYPGCFVDPHEDMPDLLTPTVWLTEKQGAFWVVDDARGRVMACLGVDMPKPGISELHRLYVRPDARGRGLAKELTAMAEDWAMARKSTQIVAWSDTRFTNAHSLYQARGYVRQPETRLCGDVSNTTEFCFIKAIQ